MDSLGVPLSESHLLMEWTYRVIDKLSVVDVRLPLAITAEGRDGKIMRWLSLINENLDVCIINIILARETLHIYGVHNR